MDMSNRESLALKNMPEVIEKCSLNMIVNLGYSKEQVQISFIPLGIKWETIALCGQLIL